MYKWTAKKGLKGVTVQTESAPFGWEVEDAASSSFQHASENGVNAVWEGPPALHCSSLDWPETV